MSLYDRIILVEKIERGRRKVKASGWSRNDPYIGWDGAKTQTKHGEVSTWVDRGGSEPLYKTTFMSHAGVKALHRGDIDHPEIKSKELGSVQSERKAKQAHSAHVKRVRGVETSSLYVSRTLVVLEQIMLDEGLRDAWGRAKKSVARGARNLALAGAMVGAAAGGASAQDAPKGPGAQSARPAATSAARHTADVNKRVGNSERMLKTVTHGGLITPAQKAAHVDMANRVDDMAQRLKAKRASRTQAARQTPQPRAASTKAKTSSSLSDTWNKMRLD